ncbi:unnamed protein product [Microthlaspi erraticum]|uniref:F-box domain-containing protein n=1 Tax=Microthlaspi erraticum TaxID=1685480 RepID=A0A6D2KC81_9BRAS|nr:unnamed protein product [Microthlaspi erraticum]
MSTMYDWSKPCLDILQSIFKRLNRKDFHRARTVCSTWYTVSETCMPPPYPWRLVFRKYSVWSLDPEGNDVRENKFSTLLFDPEEDSIREIEYPELDLSEKYCIASCSNWLLMVDQRLNFNILNVFTRETIILPSMEPSLLGIQQGDDDDEEDEYFISRNEIEDAKRSAVLWINERTRDYVVAFAYKRDFLFTFKKGDEAWRRNLQGTRCDDMAFKDNKLYVLALDNFIKIVDLSGDLPRESLENPYLNHRFTFRMGPRECIWKRRIAISKSGEVLVIQSSKVSKDKFVFQIFKMNVESSKWEIVDSLGDEMLIFGHGVTVRTSVKGGSICFAEDDIDPCKGSGVFDLATGTITWAKQVGKKLSESRWFVPGYC